MRNTLLLSAVVLLVALSAGGQEIAPQGGPHRGKTTDGDAGDLAGRLVDAATAQAADGIGILGCSTTPPLTCGSTTTASPQCLNGDFFLDLYSVSATAGQTLTIEATTVTSYDMLLTVQSSSGPILASRTGPTRITLTYNVPSSATYYIGFGYVARFATGSYTLRVTCGTTTPGQCRSTGTLTRRVATNGQLGPADAVCANNGKSYYKVYDFTGTIGAPIRITATGSFPLYIEAASDGSSSRLTHSPDADEPAMIFYPTESGRQWVWIGQDLDTPRSGTFTVTIDDEPLEACRRRAVRR
jgi:hypothetical protein